ncbi:hypothetical protein [Dactylosporangium salmoneum]|uniref:WD40 repeat protein n=1 Tax=Dactylosporangium salmoneum TaxID=53361 RepID=A0ABN3HBA9_9ACTN
MRKLSVRRPVLAATALLSGSSLLMLLTACGDNGTSADAAPATAAPSAPATVTATAEAPPAASIEGLPGRLYYLEGSGPTVVRIDKGNLVKVDGVAGYTANVSPDGTAIAFMDHDKLVVTDRDGKHPHTLLTGVPGPGYEPQWSTDSKHLLAAKGPSNATPTWGTIDVTTGTFTPLTEQARTHVLWSADGKHIAYSNGQGKIMTADADGTNPHTIPILGDPDTTTNPENRRSFDPYSISADGTLVALLQLTKANETNGDIGRDLEANTLIDTRTGNVVNLPVTGPISAIAFQPDGTILVRTPGKLTLLNADRTVRTTVNEPAGLDKARLLAYVAN